MRTGRLEAFSDAVLAIIITVMVLGLREPSAYDLGTFWHTTGHGLVTYALSFAYIAIYWHDHHHLFHLIGQVSSGILWANLVLLFCLSLLPFTTGWMAHSHLHHTPLFVYGLNLLLVAGAYAGLRGVVLRAEGPSSLLRQAIGRDLIGKLAPLLYLVGMLSAVLQVPFAAGVALGCYGAVAVAWIIRDRRIAAYLNDHQAP